MFSFFITKRKKKKNLIPLSRNERIRDVRGFFATRVWSVKQGNSPLST